MFTYDSSAPQDSSVTHRLDAEIERLRSTIHDGDPSRVAVIGLIEVNCFTRLNLSTILKIPHSDGEDPTGSESVRCVSP